MFGATTTVKNSKKSKYVYSGYGIAFDGEISWIFANDFAKIVVISGVDNSSSFHYDNPKNNFLVFGEGLTDDINASFGTAEKKLQ